MLLGTGLRNHCLFRLGTQPVERVLKTLFATVLTFLLNHMTACCSVSRLYSVPTVYLPVCLSQAAAGLKRHHKGTFLPSGVRSAFDPPMSSAAAVLRSSGEGRTGSRLRAGFTSAPCGFLGCRPRTADGMNERASRTTRARGGFHSHHICTHGTGQTQVSGRGRVRRYQEEEERHTSGTITKYTVVRSLGPQDSLTSCHQDMLLPSAPEVS